MIIKILFKQFLLKIKMVSALYQLVLIAVIQHLLIKNL
jgi:hypothetical protein